MGIMDLPITFGRNGYGCVETLNTYLRMETYITHQIRSSMDPSVPGVKECNQKFEREDPLNQQY